ncbi:MAG: hypothetical protein AAB399_00155 [Patescibacteria group bacterium]
MKTKKRKNNGQVMIMVVIMIGGLLLAATAIAGLLTIYQVRQSNDAVSSAQAFFAADAALEWQLAVHNKKISDTRPLTFDNGATATSNFNSLEDGSLDFTSQGFSGNTIRVLETIFENPGS